VCAKTPLSGRVWLHKLGHVCDECHALPGRCHHCGLPVREGFVKTSDGRLYCRRDHPRLVFSTNEATRVFHESMEAALRMSGQAMGLRQPTVTVSLFDVDYWNAKDTPPELRRNGFSHSRRTGEQFSHTVVLLSGQARDDLRSVCAHEFTHLWINENRAGARQIDPDTLEAICELIPYKLALTARDTNQLHTIRFNPYTRGMITNLITAEARHGLGAILAWVKEGQAATLEEGQLAAFSGRLAVSGSSTTVAPALAEDVILTGLAGSANRRMALINGQVFKPAERRRVRLKDRSVMVQCLEIRADAVLVRINDAPEPRLLGLEHK
jgi:hypothetical protein